MYVLVLVTVIFVHDHLSSFSFSYVQTDLNEERVYRGFLRARLQFANITRVRDATATDFWIILLLIVRLLPLSFCCSIGRIGTKDRFLPKPRQQWPRCRANFRAAAVRLLNKWKLMTYITRCLQTTNVVVMRKVDNNFNNNFLGLSNPIKGFIVQTAFALPLASSRSMTLLASTGSIDLQR